MVRLPFCTKRRILPCCAKLGAVAPNAAPAARAAIVRLVNFFMNTLSLPPHGRRRLPAAAFIDGRAEHEAPRADVLLLLGHVPEDGHWRHQRPVDVRSHGSRLIPLA